MRLLEIVRGTATARDALATVLALGKLLQKVSVVSGVCDGFIGNRMLEHYGKQANYLLEEGASPRQVDAAMEAFGFAMGPFKVGDLAGNDIGWNIRKRRRAEKPGYRFSTLPDKLCEIGRFGQKTGAGWYEYPDGRKPLPSKAVDELIAEHRRGLGITPRKIDDAEIVDRLVYALVNEGARILDEGIAARSSDIDVVYLTGYGFPAMRGGPMFHADSVGLPLVQRRMREFARNPHGDPEFWKPAALIERLVASGESFATAAPLPRRPRRSRRKESRHERVRRAVIVSTARTPLAKSFRGAFNMSHGAHLGGVAVRAATRARGHRTRRSRGRASWAAPIPRVPRAATSRASSPTAPAVPATVAGTTVNRFCSSGLQTIALAAQRIVAGEDGIYVAGGVESISTVQPNRNQHMARDSWTVEHKPELYLPMVETAEIVAKRYGIRRERMDEYGVRSQIRACAADAAGHFQEEIIATPATMAVVGDDGRFATREVVVERDEGSARRHHL